MNNIEPSRGNSQPPMIGSFVVCKNPWQTKPYNVPKALNYPIYAQFLNTCYKEHEPYDKR
jgi:hypothetical protein